MAQVTVEIRDETYHIVWYKTDGQLHAFPPTQSATLALDHVTILANHGYPLLPVGVRAYLEKQSKVEYPDMYKFQNLL